MDQIQLEFVTIFNWNLYTYQIFRFLSYYKSDFMSSSFQV